jgi:hypothetical protein
LKLVALDVGVSTSADVGGTTINQSHLTLPLINYAEKNNMRGNYPKTKHNPV